MKLRELTHDELALVEEAHQIADSQADGLVHTVGAAVRDAEGKIHRGVNLFSLQWWGHARNWSHSRPRAPTGPGG
ncbi:MAG: hypothetical protein M3450_06420 [Actinomycetota bacterium]|nr:hypothetical protein [Actinomycetota bacterium]